MRPQTPEPSPPDLADPWREFRQTLSERAFAEVVQRHTSLVYGTAFRITGDTESARDVAQTVFLELHGKAQTLPSEVILAGWLYRATTFAARKIRRADQRRLTRETEAMRQQALHSGTFDPHDPTEELLPLLDEALSRLPEAERHALILRFLSQEDWRSVGVSLGVSEEAARKRVERALVRLREGLQGQGLTVSIPTLALALGAIGSQSAPPAMAAGLVAGISAISGGTDLAAGSALIPALFGTKGILAALGVVTALCLPLARQEMELQSLRKEFRMGSGVVRAATPADSDAILSATGDSGDEQADLVRLREEARRLRSAAESLPIAAASPPLKGTPGSSTPPGKLVLLPGVQVTVGDLLEAGNATPEAAMQSSLAAYQDGNFERLLELQLLDAGARKKFLEELANPDLLDETRERIRTEMKRDRERGKTYEIAGTQPDGPDRVEIELQVRIPGEPLTVERKILGHTGDGWRLLPVVVPPVSKPDPNSPTEGRP